VVVPLVAIGFVLSTCLVGQIGLRVGVARAAAAPAGYLLAAQNPDGGFGGAPGQPSAQLFSGWAALGLAAEGYNPQDVSKGAHSLLDYLSAGPGTGSDPGTVERTILAVAASGVSPASFGGRDLVAALERDISRNGSVSGQTNLTSFAVLALRAAGVTPQPRTLAWLVRQQDRDGGFNFATAGAVSDVDDTGAALEALAAVPGSKAAHARRRAAAFIERQQDRDGGFPQAAGAGSNSQSTAWAVQGLLAAGVAGAPVSRALSYLDSLIAADGHVRYSRTSDQTPVWVTAEAAMALAEKPLPLAPVRVRRSHRPLASTRRNPVRRAGGARGRLVHRRPPRGRRTAPAPVRPSRLSMTLATDAGIVEALALAPLGVG
jgi:energy-coupling factor transport system substrate-specific component